LFDTAWSHPFELLLELSKLFPYINFTIFYADEDMGNNCGKYKMIQGQMVAEYDVGEGTERGRNFARRLFNS
jgi:hypothetical protein